MSERRVFPGGSIQNELVKPGDLFSYSNATRSAIGVTLLFHDGGTLQFNVASGQRFEFQVGSGSGCTVYVSDPLSLVAGETNDPSTGIARH